MKDTLTSNNHQDFRQRYLGTYGLYTPEGKSPMLVRLIEIDSECVKFTDSRGGNYTAYADSGIPFEFFPVERKLSNSRLGVLYSYRKPARQYFRGLCLQNTGITKLVDGSGLSVNFSNIKLITDKTPYSEWVSKFQEKEINQVALSNRFAIVSDKVYMFDTVVGSYSDNTVDIDDLYSQEFSDLIKRNNWSIGVK